MFDLIDEKKIDNDEMSRQKYQYLDTICDIFENSVPFLLKEEVTNKS